jgi:hypothetical protein
MAEDKKKIESPPRSVTVPSAKVLGAGAIDDVLDDEKFPPIKRPTFETCFETECKLGKQLRYKYGLLPHNLPYMTIGARRQWYKIALQHANEAMFETKKRACAYPMLAPKLQEQTDHTLIAAVPTFSKIYPGSAHHFDLFTLQSDGTVQISPKLSVSMTILD